MSPNPRALRLADQIQFEISDIIRNRLRDPRKGFITITAVEVTPDLRAARVFVSALGGPEELASALALLEHARGFLRTELGKRVQTRFVPELSFRADDSAARGIRIDRILDDLKQGRTPDEPEGGEGKE
jgi:ribosome-binding factor A